MKKIKKIKRLIISKTNNNTPDREALVVSYLVRFDGLQDQWGRLIKFVQTVINMDLCPYQLSMHVELCEVCNVFF